MTVALSNISTQWTEAGKNYTVIGVNVSSTAYGTDSNLIRLRKDDNDLFVVDSSGNVGIGTPNPTSILDTTDHTNPQVVRHTIRNANTTAGSFTDLVLYSNNYTQFIQLVNYAQGAGYLSFFTPGGGNIYTDGGPLYISTAGSPRLTVTGTGNVGIGTTNPTSNLHVVGDATISDNLGVGIESPTSKLHVIGSANVTGLLTAADLVVDSANGTTRAVQYNTSGVIRWLVYANNVEELGANTGSNFRIARYSDDGTNIGVPFEINRATGEIYLNGDLILNSGREIKVGGSALRSGTDPTNSLTLFNGTAPSGTLTNGVTLYSSSGELRVMDSLGNATLLSPHDDITNEWIFDSTESTNGRTLRIRVESLLRRLNSEFGWDYVSDIAGDGTDQSKTMDERVNEERERRLATFTFNGKLYDLNRTAKTDIAGAGTLALSAIMIENAQPGDLRWADPTSDFGWIAYDNTITLMDAQTTLAFAKEAAAHYKKIIFAARLLKDMNPIPEDFKNDSYWT